MKVKITIVLSLLISNVQAQNASKEISDGFKKLAPMAKISQSTKTPIKGINQIVLDSNNIDDVYYMTDDGKYFINGSIIEVDSRKNLTEKSKTTKRQKIVSQFGDKERINFYPKDKKMTHHVTVYTDIDCGYCRKMHTEIKQYNDLGIGISYLFWPRSGLKSKSFDKAVTAWCAVDQKAAFTSFQNGMELESKQCDNPIKQQYISGTQIGVNGTPNIVTDKGELIPTYMPAKALLQKLEMLAAQKP